jgi:enamine deaminase RidA (YjgF/YER057c/UK114 family)
MTRHHAASLVLALLPFLAPLSAGAQDIVRHKNTGSALPIAQAVSVAPGVALHFVSGQVPPSIDKDANQDTPAAYGDTRTQAIGVLTRIQDVLRGMGMTMADVVKMQVFLVGDPARGGKADTAGFADAYARFFGLGQPNLPARALVQVAALGNPGWLVEIEVVAATSR